MDLSLSSHIMYEIWSKIVGNLFHDVYPAFRSFLARGAPFCIILTLPHPEASKTMKRKAKLSNCILSYTCSFIDGIFSVHITT